MLFGSHSTAVGISESQQHLKNGRGELSVQFPLTYDQDVLSSHVSPISRLHEIIFFTEGTVALISGDGPTDVRAVCLPFSPCVQLLLLFQDRGYEAQSQKAPLLGSFPLVAPQHRCSLGPLHPTLSRPWEICSPSGERIGPFFFPFGRLSGVY